MHSCLYIRRFNVLMSFAGEKKIRIYAKRQSRSIIQSRKYGFWAA